MAALLQGYPEVRHVQVEDGKGRPLGRSFRVKWWPTLVFLRDGKVIRQSARPDAAEIAEGLEAIDGKGLGGPAAPPAEGSGRP